MPPYLLNHELQDLIDVTPSRVEFEREKAERVSRGAPPPTCQICEVLLSWFVDRQFAYHDEAAQQRRRLELLGVMSSPCWVIHLGTFEEALTSQCPQHTAIVKYLQLKLIDDDLFGYRQRYQLDGDVGFICDPYHVTIMRYPSSRDPVTRVLDLELPADPAINHRGTFRVIDREWVDLPVISRWIDDCSRSHGEECKNPMKIGRAFPELLVDVQRKCIVEGREDSRYMALSYRLGNAAPFRLGFRDLDAFRNDGALEDAQILGKLPLTVRHAILLAHELGFDHLWTDVLCIVHDGPATLADQLNKMSAIYASATLTIVATDGDGIDGILGLRGISPPRDPPQATFPICDAHLLVTEALNIDVTNRNVAYNSRGWTYQEYIMSPRKLVFMNHEAHWICEGCQRRESEVEVMESRIRKGYNPSPFILSGHPDLDEFSELLSWYNVRDLTFPGDALPAISGLLAVLSRGFEGGFLYGLPQRFFDIGLGWRPFAYNSGGRITETTCTTRRGPSLDCKSYNKTPATPGMPSWSWTAWRGGFLIGNHEVARVEPWGYKRFCETSPITEWFTGSKPSGSMRRRIMSNWHVDRKSIDDQGKRLPDGWTRMEACDAFKERRQPPSVFWRPIVYQHQSSGYDEFWYYPFRMPEINDSTHFEIPEQTRYLFCKTRRASVLLDDLRDQEQFSPPDIFRRGLWANDLDLRGEKPRIGRLWLHYAEQFEEETGGGLADDSAREGRIAIVNVVSISRSSHSGKRRFDKEQRLFKERINILWVKWEQGIAYRVASGYVYEEDWNSLETEEIDLVLG